MSIPEDQRDPANRASYSLDADGSGRAVVWLHLPQIERVTLTRSVRGAALNIAIRPEPSAKDPNPLIRSVEVPWDGVSALLAALSRALSDELVRTNDHLAVMSEQLRQWQQAG